MAKIDFATAIPTSYRLIGSISTFDYFKKDKLFSRNNKPAFNQKDERFLKLQVGLPFLSEMTNLIKAAMIYLVDQLVLMEVLLIPNNILHVDTEKPL